MQQTDSHLSNEICSCTSCFYKSKSCDPNVQRILRDGSRIDRLFLGKYIPLRERKLLKRLARTRAVYDDIGCQLVNESSTCIDERYFTPRQDQACCEDYDDTEGNCVTGRFSNIRLQNRHSSDRCSCCSCDAFNSPIKQRRYRHDHGYPHGGYSFTPETFRGPRNVRFNAIKSEPCTCTSKDSLLIKRRSKNVARKLRAGRSQLQQSTDYSVGEHRKRQKNKKTYQKQRKSKSRFTQDEDKWTKDENSEAIKTSKKTKTTKPNTGVKRTTETIKQPYVSEGTSFFIKKDSVTKFKDDLEKRRNYINTIVSKHKPCKSVSPGRCYPGECDPMECCRILEKRLRKRRRKENKLWRDEASAMYGTQRYQSIDNFDKSQRTLVSDQKTEAANISARGAVDKKRKSESSDEISKNRKVGKAIRIREDITDKSEKTKKENAKAEIRKEKRNTILHIKGKNKRHEKDVGRLQSDFSSVNTQKEKKNKQVNKLHPRSSQTKFKSSGQRDDDYTGAKVFHKSKALSNVPTEFDYKTVSIIKPDKKKIVIKVGSINRNSAKKPDKKKIKADEETKHTKRKNSETNFSLRKSSYKLVKHRLRKCFCTLKLASRIAKQGKALDYGFDPYECDSEVCDPNSCLELIRRDENNYPERYNDRFMKRSSKDYRKAKSTSSIATKPNKLRNIHSSNFSSRKRMKNRTPRQVTATSSSPGRQFVKDHKEAISDSSYSLKKGKRKGWVNQRAISSTDGERRPRSSFILPTAKKCFCTLQKQSSKDNNLNDSFTVSTEAYTKIHEMKNKKTGKSVLHSYDGHLELKGRRKRKSRQTLIDRPKLKSKSSITYKSAFKPKEVPTKLKQNKKVLSPVIKRKSKKALSPVVDLKIPRQTVRYGSNISFTIEFRKYTQKPNIYTVSRVSRNKCEWPGAC